MTGIAVEPRYAEVVRGSAVDFTVSGRGDMPADYQVILTVEGVNVLEEWFEGPDTFEYSVSHSFDILGARPIVARLTELPAGYVWEMTGQITVVTAVRLILPLVFSMLPLAVGAVLYVGLGEFG